MKNIFLLNDKNKIITFSIILYMTLCLLIMFINDINYMNIIISTVISIISGSLFGYFLISYFNSNKAEYKICDIEEFNINSNYITVLNFHKKRYKYKIIINGEKKWTNSDYLKKYNIGDTIVVYNNNKDSKISNNVLAPLIGSGMLFITFSILPLLNIH